MTHKILSPSFDWTNVDFTREKKYNRDEEPQVCTHPNSPHDEDLKLYRFPIDPKSASDFSEYTLLFQCGKGRFGKVYCASYKEGQVAMKFFSQARLPGQELYEAAREELDMLTAAKGAPNVLQLKGWGTSLSSDKFYLITDVHQSLKDALPTKFDLPRIQKIARGFFKGIDGLHRRGIIHCDIKPKNLLVNAQGEGVVADLGLSIYCDEKKYYPTQTLRYRDPSVLLKRPYNHTIDLWSIGTVLFELAKGEVLFESEDELHAVHLIVQLLGMPSEEFILAGNQWTEYFETNTLELKSLPPGNFKKLRPGLNSLKAACIQHGQSLELSEHYVCLIGRLVTYGDKISAADALQSPFLAQNNQE